MRKANTYETYFLQIFTVSCFFALANANPVAGPGGIGGNDLFQQLNDIIKRGIDTQVKTEDSIDIGDKIKSDDGNFKISISQFTSGNGFPLQFDPEHKDVLEDKELVVLDGDFNGSGEYVLQQKSSSEESNEENSTANSALSTTSTTQATSSNSAVTGATISTSSTTASSSTVSSTKSSATTASSKN